MDGVSEVQYLEKTDASMQLTHAKHFLESLYLFKNEGKFVDVILSCETSVISAHRLVLSVNSPVLCALMGESFTNSDVRISVDHLGIGVNCLALLVHFMYTGCLLYMPNINDHDLMQGAQILGMSTLLKILEAKTLEVSVETNYDVHDRVLQHVSSYAGDTKQTVANVGEKIKGQSSGIAMCAQDNPKETLHHVPESSLSFVGTCAENQFFRNDFTPNNHHIITSTQPYYEILPVNNTQNLGGEDNGTSAAEENTAPQSSSGNVDGIQSQSSSPVESTPLDLTPSKLKSPNLLRKKKEEAVKVTKKSSNLVKPIKREDGKWECSECGFVSDKHRKMYTHRITRHTYDKHHVCQKCGKAFKLRKYLSQHLQIHMDEKPFRCDVCNSTFRTKKNKKRHMLTHSINKKDLSCRHCALTFLTLSECRAHVTTVHKGMKAVSCSVKDCNYSTLDPNCLKKHMTKHGGECKESVLCEICGKEFSGSLTLRWHVKSVHGDPSFICNKCSYRANTKFSLVSHMARKHNISLDGSPVKKNFKCNECEASFFTRQEVTVHKLKHKGEKPHQCPVCDFATIEKGTLKKHVRLHTGEKPYRCELCDMKFSHPSGIARHRLKHSGIKPYKCDHCEKAYLKKSSLAAHMFVHSDVKPFQCNKCSYGCVKKSALDNHIAKRHCGNKEQSFSHGNVPQPLTSSSFPSMVGVPSDLPSFSYAISGQNNSGNNIGDAIVKQHYINLDNLAVMTPEGNHTAFTFADHLSQHMGQVTQSGGQGHSAANQQLSNQVMLSEHQSVSYSGSDIEIGSHFLPNVGPVMYAVESRADGKQMQLSE